MSSKINIADIEYRTAPAQHGYIGHAMRVWCTWDTALAACVAVYVLWAWVL